MVQELHSANDFLLAGAMVRLLTQRIDLLLRAERLTAGTPEARMFDGPLRQAIAAEQAAKSMLAYLARQESTVH